MARTRPDVLTSRAAWVNLNDASGIPVGDQMALQNKGQGSVLLIEDDAPPAADDGRGELLGPRQRMTVTEGSLTIWARSTGWYQIPLSVQEV